jgi:hypothetical protein
LRPEARRRPRSSSGSGGENQPHQTAGARTEKASQGLQKLAMESPLGSPLKSLGPKRGSNLSKVS